VSAKIELQCHRDFGRTAVVFGVAPGMSGLGHFAATAVAGLSSHPHDMFALGPRRSSPWPLPGEPTPAVRWIEAPPGIPAWVGGYTWLRWRAGDWTALQDRHLARWAANQLQQLNPDACFSFTQVGLEALRWCRARGIPTVLDNPNGHIRNFQQVYERESARWFGKKFWGHPAPSMVERVEREYELADRIVVHSHWAKRSMMQHGVADEKIAILGQSINLERFRPPASRPPAKGPLRVCFVGSLDLRKGFVYLLKAIRAVGAKHVHLRIAGATGDRNCSRLFIEESRGLQVEAAPADPVPIYHSSELFVLPSLEDGLGLVALEAAACNLPVIVTDQCGAQEYVEPGKSGWIIPPADTDALATAMETALQSRVGLWDMGTAGRRYVEESAGASRLADVGNWFFARTEQGVCS